MQIVRRREDLVRACAEARGAGRLGFVPTMGALHDGHVRLVEEARASCDRVAVSIFVNPLQFAAGEDLGRYPRREEEDATLLEAAGCDILWLPRSEDIYPEGFATSVRVSGLSERWEGEARPGHFDGVATVVAKLFNAVFPDAAWFGEKDFQQLAVIRQMVRDLDFQIEIVGVPIVRDGDGLALSSRNAYLSADERARALALPNALHEAREALCGGEQVAAALQRGKDRLAQAGFASVDYFALVDPATLEPLGIAAGDMRLIAAATLGATRLIDNIAV